MYSEGSFRGSGVIRPGERCCFCAIESWPDCLVGSTQGRPRPCFLQIIRRLKQACFLIQLKKSQQLSPLEEIHGNQSCCPSKPPRGLTEIPDVRMFFRAAGEVRSKAKQGKKMGPGKSGHSPQGFHVPREQALPPPVRPPSSSTGDHVGSHTRPLVLEVPLYGRLTFPAFPKLSQ